MLECRSEFYNRIPELLLNVQIDIMGKAVKHPVFAALNLYPTFTGPSVPNWT